MTDLIPIYHETSQDGCGGIAFLWKGECCPGANISAENVLKINGEDAVANEEIICGNCGRKMHYNVIVRKEYME